MVERLRREGAGDARVLAAFAEVPRHLFVDAALATQAYEDTSLPIGHGQTISKPSVVARMLELLFGGGNTQASGHLGAVLEIGTGCGYQAARRLGRALATAARQGAHAARDDARDAAAPRLRRRPARPCARSPVRQHRRRRRRQRDPAGMAPPARGRRQARLAGAAARWTRPGARCRRSACRRVCPHHSRGSEVRPLKIRPRSLTTFRLLHMPMIEASALRRCLVLLAAGVLAAACSNAPNRAPVEERTVASRSAVAARPAASAASAAETSPAAVVTDSNAGKAGFYTVKSGDTLIRIG